MGFKEVASLDADVTIALGKTNKETGRPYPKQAEGYYLGSRAVENKRGKSSLHFFQSGIAYKELGLGVGQNLGVWGTTDLDRKLGQVTPGTMVRVTSTGTKPTPNGEMYTYRVEADDTNTIDVTGLNTAAAPADYDDDSGDSEEVAETDVAPIVVDRAARAAEVQAMLKNRKSKTN